MIEIPITQARKNLFFMSIFGSDTPFMLLAKLKVKEDKVSEYLEIADTVLIALLKGNNLDLKSMLKKDGLIKKNIKKEATYRINFCRKETKKAIPKLVKKLPEGVVLDEERIESLTSVFPLQYLSMFEQLSKYKK